VNAAQAKTRFGFTGASSNYADALADPATNAVAILTRHDSHAHLASEALRAGKHVFVEKPLALTQDELCDVAGAAAASGHVLAVGFNRRWAPLARAVMEGMRGRAGPVSIAITVNAGALPPDHWTRDPAIGGGRIVGEACHFIDLARFLAGCAIRAISVATARDAGGSVIEDIASITLEFADGSLAQIHYFANGSRRFPKERVECAWDGRIACIENWNRARGYGWSAPRTSPFATQDKGHRAEIEAFASAVRKGGPPPVPLAEVIEVSRWSIIAGELARRGGGRVDE
jgi:predicted dehydrogenase